MSKWTYYYNNIGTGKKVATLINRNGMEVLDVYEGAYSHYTVPRYNFLQVFSVNYTRENGLLNEHFQNDDRPLREKMLNIGCEEIREDYRKQVKNIKLILGLKD